LTIDKTVEKVQFGHVYLIYGFTVGIISVTLWGIEAKLQTPVLVKLLEFRCSFLCPLNYFRLYFGNIYYPQEALILYCCQ